jgi:hypothetical protein
MIGKNATEMPKKNVERASWAWNAMETFMKETGLADDDVFETVAGDFLGDFLHMCDLLGVDFEELLEKGREHHRVETACALCKNLLKAGDDADGMDPICAACDKEQES